MLTVPLICIMHFKRNTLYVSLYLYIFCFSQYTKTGQISKKTWERCTTRQGQKEIYKQKLLFYIPPLPNLAYTYIKGSTDEQLLKIDACGKAGRRPWGTIVLLRE